MRTHILFVLILMLVVPSVAVCAKESGDTGAGQQVSRDAGEDIKGRAIGLEGPTLFYNTQSFAPASFSGDKGKVSYQSHTVGFSQDFLTVMYGRTFFQWGDKDKLPLGGGSIPWKELHTLRVGLSHNDWFNKQWGYAVGGGVRLSWEEEMDQSHYLNAYGSLMYAINRDWQVSFGAWVFMRPNLAVQVLPLPQLHWRRGVKEGFSASIGIPVTKVSYRFSETFALHVGGGYSTDTFRLADDSPVQRKGYAETHGITAGIYANWTPFKHFKLIAGPEYQFGRKLSVYDKDGDKRNSYKVDGAPALSLRLAYVF